jgi:hypothetical protein
MRGYLDKPPRRLAERFLAPGGTLLAVFDEP